MDPTTTPTPRPAPATPTPHTPASTSAPAPAPTRKATEVAVMAVDDLEPGAMKMAKVGERRVVVIRSASGFHALDNACPHQGFGLATGSLNGELLTCQWHNWKFRIDDGRCVIGQEDIARHDVRVADGQVFVSITEQTDAEKLTKLWPSLQRGIERHYTGQIARDTARLLQAGATPEAIVAMGLRHGLPRTEWGMGHDMAVCADLLALCASYEGIDKTLPLVHALAGFAEQQRDRTPHWIPQFEVVDADQQTFVHAIEAEDAAGAVNQVRSLLASSAPEQSLDVARSWFIDAVSRHHYNYGHGAIYTQKAFALAEAIPDTTELLLSELALTLVYGTREDTLPYMTKPNRAIDGVDLTALAATPGHHDTGWADQQDILITSLLDADQAPIAEMVAAAHQGAGVSGLLNAISLAAAQRMLRYDLTVEQDGGEEFGWLDMTHAMTYVNAARWAWATVPGPHSARLALLTGFLVFDAGRLERRRGQVELSLPEPASGDLFAAIVRQDPDAAVAAAMAAPTTNTADQLERASLEDTAGSFIVTAHLIKTAVAARHEAQATGSKLPLVAAARFLASPRTERFVARSAREAIDFVGTGRPPTR